MSDDLCVSEWDELREKIFDDFDVLELFNVTPAERSAARDDLRRLGRNLHPDDWFTPFSPETN